MLATVNPTMEKEFDSKLRIESSSSSSNNDGGNDDSQRSKVFSFRAPQENFSIQDFELGKIYGVGSYSKCVFFVLRGAEVIAQDYKIYGVGSYSKFDVSCYSLPLFLIPLSACSLKVVRAKKKDTGKIYAMKIMDKKFITKENKTAYVKLERIVLDQLDHPGVVRLFFTFQDNFSLYMALESCEGGELFDQITRKGRLSEEDARFYAAEVVDALKYIHSMGLIHRDIKPENLLLTEDGHIKVADFGSVKPMQGSQITVLPNAASDDKACTFVGTAAYVPPEVLNSSPATFGYEDIDPSQRLGAGPNGYLALKSHPFFKGVDWINLRDVNPPQLALDPAAQSPGCEDHDSSWNPTHVGDGSVKTSDGSAAVASASDTGSINRLASIDSFDSKWQQFLEPGESVLMISMVKKLQKLSSKKVQLILTNKPKLIYVDPAKLEVRGNIIWSDNPAELNVQVISPSNFKICTPKKVMCFDDAKQRAAQWKKAIEALQNRSQNGIQLLLSAEQEAQHIVNTARTAKQARLKQAKEEAEKEIAEFRYQMEADFQNKVEESSGDSGANVKRLEQETDARIDHLKAEASRISHDIVSMLLRHVTTVKN
ncbi:hypothetical protein SASPL_136822 [Salvia splendens]|uniref:non-specific serine/threonine protein kinase n=1 Tax=Salvia splendens TaxID=180675 RepID=A0A8X8X1B4_SALSN|nr:hypothetical protein SASPL_136822 [Salvia splendens]